MDIPTSQLIVLFVSLFTIFSPPAMIGPIAAITGKYPRKRQRRIAWQVAGSYVLVLIVSAWIGQWLLSILGVTVGGLMVAGGLALFLVGLPLMMKGSKGKIKEMEEDEESDEKDNMTKGKASLIVPLVFPMAIGGATAAIVIAQASQWKSALDLLAISGVCALMALVIFLTYYFSGPIAQRLRPHSLDILGRISGIILVAIAAQLFIAGVLELIADPGVINLIH